MGHCLADQMKNMGLCLLIKMEKKTIYTIQIVIWTNFEMPWEAKETLQVFMIFPRGPSTKS